MLIYISENYEGDERAHMDKAGDEIVSSYRLFSVAHNSSALHSWVVLKFLVEEITELKIIKTAMRWNSLSFHCGVQIVKTVEVPQYLGEISCKKFFRKNR